MNYLFFHWTFSNELMRVCDGFVFIQTTALKIAKLVALRNALDEAPWTVMPDAETLANGTHLTEVEIDQSSSPFQRLVPAWTGWPQMDTVTAAKRATTTIENAIVKRQMGFLSEQFEKRRGWYVRQTEENVAGIAALNFPSISEITKFRMTHNGLELKGQKPVVMHWSVLEKIAEQVPDFRSRYKPKKNLRQRIVRRK